ncbi:methyltransferase-like 26 B [Hippocampus zosterae]|uniref:methyltransferase-like 26 B n=1 Tax=Hippocampus zosterae TaxID=109293 RepID=UPI00223D3C6B|nr:methyltransferase-like 26 B [Hippocampus zosterae]XP_051905525.1 methyltransferase-like 26 B [Hippocampus zosterae]
MLLSPQAERNWEEVCSLLQEALEEQSHRQLFALELGSGTGQHVIRFAQKMPFVTWQPSDIQEEARQSIKAYIAATNVTTVLPPVHLDASEPWEKWAGVCRGSCDVIVAINLLQYSPFKTAQGVFNGAGQIIKHNGLLVTYGAYAINGTITPRCNELLHEELRKVNPEWGLPDVDVLRQLAYENGMRMERMVDMEECYKCLIFRKI